MEPAGLSERNLVLQSIRLAIAFCVWRLVRPGRRRKIVGRAALARHAGRRHCLSGVRFPDRDDLAYLFPRTVRAGLAGVADLSHRQDQSRRPALRAFPRARDGDRLVRPAGLVRLAMADLPPGDLVWTTFARSLLLW